MESPHSDRLPLVAEPLMPSTIRRRPKPVRVSARRSTTRGERKVVDAHDGRIDIQTGADGTRFRVTLPISGANDWFVTKPGLPRSLTDD